MRKREKDNVAFLVKLIMAQVLLQYEFSHCILGLLDNIMSIKSKWKKFGRRQYDLRLRESVGVWNGNIV